MIDRKVFLRAVAALFVLTASVAVPAKTNSHSGAWHCEESRTWWSDKALPKGFSLTLFLEFSANQMTYRSVNDTDKSKDPQGIQFATNLDGTVQLVPDQKDNGYDQISFKQVGANEYRMLRWLTGELVAAQFWTFSADGKEMVRRGATRTPSGPWHAYEEWFVRQ